MRIEVVHYEDAFGIMADAIRAVAQDPEYAENIIDRYGDDLEREAFQIEVPEE